MTPPEPAAARSYETLLEHREWVRALARSLVARQADADDGLTSVLAHDRHRLLSRSRFRNEYQSAARFNGNSEGIIRARCHHELLYYRGLEGGVCAFFYQGGVEHDVSWAVRC